MMKISLTSNLSNSSKSDVIKQQPEIMGKKSQIDFLIPNILNSMSGSVKSVIPSITAANPNNITRAETASSMSKSGKGSLSSIDSHNSTAFATLAGDKLPEGKAGPAAHFSEVRDHDIEQLQLRLSRPQIQENPERMERLQSLLDFMQENTSASYLDAKRYYNSINGRGPLASHQRVET